MSKCRAVEDPRFSPAMRLITSISKDRHAVITTSFAHGYSTGQVVRFYIPNQYGMPQLDGKKLPITVTGVETFTIKTDTSKYSDFSVPVDRWYYNSCATIVPIGKVIGSNVSTHDTT